MPEDKKKEKETLSCPKCLPEVTDAAPQKDPTGSPWHFGSFSVALGGVFPP